MTRRTASGAGLLRAAALLFLSATVVHAATFQVTNTSDSGAGSLRQAILEANFLGGQDTIAFQIPGPGPYVIAPLSQLPTITDPTIVDGQTQPGYSSGGRIELSGASAGIGVNGLVIASPSTVRGLVINRFQATFGSGGNGVVLETSGGGSLLLDNRIGTNAAGTAVLGNAAAGVLVAHSAGNRIGATAIGEVGNVISGNGEGIRMVGLANANVVASNRIGTDFSGTQDLGNLGDGIALLGASNTTVISASQTQVISGNGGNGITIASTANGSWVAGNRIGTDVTGTIDLGNDSDGVEIFNAPGNTVGGGNLISGNGANGVLVISDSNNNVVRANFIGTDASGMADLGNSANGVIISGANGNTIGGTDTTEGNLISGNGTNGVRIRSGSSGNLVKGNRVGINHAGTAAIPNGEHGVQLNDGAANNLVGGPLDGERNVIRGNAMSGVLAADATTTGNTIQRNSIVQNAGNGVLVQAAIRTRLVGNAIEANGALGIDLGGDGVTTNDPQDADGGANLLQNFPVITRAGTTSAEGILQSVPQTPYALEFFSSPVCDPSGHGEGSVRIGSDFVMTDGGGNASFSAGSFSPAPLGHFVTATATDPDGNTSELSACIPVSARFYTLTPCRVSDSREGNSPLLGAESRVLPVAGRCGVPATAAAVAVNVTAVDSTVQGHLTLHSADVPVPLVSTINYRAGQTRANNAIVTLGGAGDLRVSAGQAVGSVHVVLDVVGYFE